MSVKIYFGTQTGTADDLASQLEFEARRYSLPCEVVDMDDFESDEFQDDTGKVVHVFLLATYHEGEPTDNAFEFHKWLSAASKSGDVKLDGIKFAVFGLGNKQYEFYNAMGRFTDKSLEGLGAQRVYRYGEGDDNDDLPGAFEEWKEDLFQELATTLFGSDHTLDASVIKFESRYTCKVSAKKPARAGVKGERYDRRVDGVPREKMSMVTRQYHNALPLEVKEKRELRQKSGGKYGSTLHLDVDLANTPFRYKSADHFLLFPENPVEWVEKLAQAFDLDADNWIEMVPKEGTGLIFPTPCTIKTALSSYCNLNGSPDRAFLKRLVPFLGDEAEKKRVALLASRDGEAEYNKWCKESMKTILQTLLEFKSLEFRDVGHLFEVLPRLQPRYFTIASCNQVHPKTVQLAISLVSKSAPDSKSGKFVGATSRFVADMIDPNATPAPEDPKKPRRKSSGLTLASWFTGKLNSLLSSADAAPPAQPIIPAHKRVYGIVVPSPFKLPRNPIRPVIMVGPGTGLAPMRAFLQQRKHEREQLGADKVGKVVLYFGCRRKEEDYIYKEELEEYVSGGVLSTLELAFSREDPKEKDYVQHHIKKDGVKLWELVHKEQAHVYVCGATNMGQSVYKAFLSIAEKSGDLEDRSAVEKYFAEMKNGNRYQQELWSD